MSTKKRSKKTFLPRIGNKQVTQFVLRLVFSRVAYSAVGLANALAEQTLPRKDIVPLLEELQKKVDELECLVIASNSVTNRYATPGRDVT